ncbi:MAG: complex I subunit 4 family protein [Bellilinea sp.]
MNFGIHPLLLVTFFPLVGVLVILFLKSQQKKAIRWTALATALVTFVLSLWMLAQFQPGTAGMQLELRVPWLRLDGLAIDFYMGVDGLSILMVLLTALLTLIAILSTWSAVEDRVKGFMIFFLLLEVGMTGVFLALDLVLFYVFWEFTLIPMYFLIGIWGGERRIYAAVKFFLFTMAGSLLMLLAILVIGFQTGTFAWSDLLEKRELFAVAQTWLFLAFGLAFAIKVPMFPLHTWLPDAHVEAPTAGSVILAGVLLKMGAYGFLRFNLPLFPEATVKFAPYMAILAIIGIIYGAAVSYAQKDMKKLVAYSSVSHLGFVVLGTFALTAQSVSGSVLQMVNHGLSTGALFLIVGMLYERRHTREMSAFGGVWKVVPVMGALMLVVTLSSMGLPGLNGFVGEFTILLGSFGSKVLGSPWFTGVATLGVILAAVYLLVMFEKVFLGPVKVEANLALKDVNLREIVTLVPLLILIFWIGLYPQPFFNLINPSVENLVSMVSSALLAAH